MKIYCIKSSVYKSTTV